MLFFSVKLLTTKRVQEPSTGAGGGFTVVLRQLVTLIKEVSLGSEEEQGEKEASSEACHK